MPQALRSQGRIMMIRNGLILLGLLLGLCRLAAAIEELSVIYNGEAQLPKRINMGFWGYRPLSNPLDNPFQPLRLLPNRRYYGLKIVTLGRYQGVRFDFIEPLDISSYLTAKDVFLELYLRAPLGTPEVTPMNPMPVVIPYADILAPPLGGDYFPPGMMTPPGGAAGVPGRPGYIRRMPGEASPYGPGVMPPGMMPPPGAPPTYPGGAGVPPTPGLTTPEDTTFPTTLLNLVARSPVTIPPPNVKNIRFTFFTDKGESLLIVTPEQFYPKEEVNRLWIRIGIPLSMIGDKLPVGGKLTRLLITSDDPVDFLIGRMAFVRDNEPILVNMFIFPPFLEAKQRIFLAARVEAGLTPYDVEWDFDTAAGNTVDATGERVTYTYATEGVYTITCTVKDKTGAKPPATSVIEVKITRALGE